MASIVYNRGKYRFASGGFDFTTSTYLLILTTSSYTPNVDHNTVSELTNELSGGGYARGTLAGKSVTQDDVNNLAVVDATDQTFSALGAAAGTPAYAILARDGANDAARDLIACLELTAPLVPNGSDYIIQFSASGILRIS